MVGAGPLIVWVKDRSSCQSWVIADRWNHSEDQDSGDEGQDRGPSQWVPRMRPRPGARNRKMKAPAIVLLGPILL